MVAENQSVDTQSAQSAAVARWAASGAMAITGRANGPALGPPDGLVPKLDLLEADLRGLSQRLGQGVDVDSLALLAERAAISRLSRQGQISCGGATRLLPAENGWLAISLARPDDFGLLEAWLRCPIEGDPWATVVQQVAAADAYELESWGAELGLPVSALPSEPPVAVTSDLPSGGDGGATEQPHVHAAAPERWELPLRARRLGDAAPCSDVRSLVVADLGSLWAGPLCGSLLGAVGADIWKLESVSRPDGARSGPAEFFDLMNAGKRSVAINLGTEDGRRTLRRIVAAVDVVIEASRPRALDQLGVDRYELVTASRPRVWVALTAHGLEGDGRNRVGFGDDIAVAGGLVAHDHKGPVFCADAVADPLAGLVAATATLRALAIGGAWLLDVDMHNVAAWFAGPTLPVTDRPPAAAPRARPRAGRGPVLGADTDDVLRVVEERLGGGT